MDETSSTCPYLFLNKHSADGKMHLRAIDNRLRKLQKELNMTSNKSVRSPHDCRRTYASILYRQGIDLSIIQSQLGHSSINQTWEYIKDVVDKTTRSKELSKVDFLGNKPK